MLKNFLMSWQYTYHSGLTGMHLSVIGLPVAWGAVGDLDACSGTNLDKKPLQTYLLENMRTWISLNETDMSDLAEVFAGGPLEGKVVRHTRAAWLQK
jgi:hypothetical protein